MRSHTGGILTLGKGAIYGTSTCQKLNTKSSTEAELVGVADVLPQILWTRYFLEAQEYGATEAILYQDNKSAILLEKHGRGSSSKRTQHIHIRYYFVADKISTKEITLQYCPTKQMIADFFTKPLQGIQFQQFFNFIMNIDPSLASEAAHRSVLDIPAENNDDTNGDDDMHNADANGKSDGWKLVENKNKNGKRNNKNKNVTANDKNVDKN